MKKFWIWWEGVDETLDSLLDNIYGNTGAGCVIVTTGFIVLSAVVTITLRWIYG